MSLAAAALLGLGLGVRHAFDADHVAAVCTLVARGGSVARAAQTGAVWGFGHGAAVVFAGGALVMAGVSVPESVSVALDIAVALMLVGLGIAAIVSRRVPAQGEGESKPALRRRPFAVGLVHGASGTGALTLLVASTIPVRMDALVFVALFGIASMIGMAAAAALFALPLRSAARRAPSLLTGIRSVAGAASIAAGIAVAWTALGTSPAS
jgi:hypothetical protein